MAKKTTFIMLVLMVAFTFSINAAITTKDMVEKAESIIIGKVVDQKAQWDNDHQNIYREVTVDVFEYLKGDSKARTLRIVIPGGEVGEVSLDIMEAPKFSIGERVLLFLTAAENNKTNEMTIVGLRNGKFSIQNNQIVENGKSLFSFKGEILYHLGKITNTQTQMPEKIQFPNPDILQQKTIIPTNKPINEGPLSNDWEYGFTCVWGDDFEDGFPGTDWVLGHNANPGVNNGYTWGKTSNNTYGGSGAVWCAQTNMIPTNPDLRAGVDEYPDDSQAWMIAGPFDLSDAYSARLSFVIDQTVEPWKDLGTGIAGPSDWTGVGFSYDGEWFYLGPDFQFFYHSTGGYIDYYINIEEVIGPLWDKSQVWICFIFWSDHQNMHCSEGDFWAGTWVDNVKLKKFDAHNANPLIVSVTPPARSAGTGKSVTIEGEHFTNEYAPQNTFIEFFSGFHWWDDSIWVKPTEVFELSEHKIICNVPEGASSGKIRIRRAKEGEGYHDFDVPFGYLGYRWYAGVGNAEGTEYPIVPFYVNVDYSNIPEALNDIIKSAHTWNMAGAAVELQFQSTTGAIGPQYDGMNTVSFAPITHVPFGTPGLTYIWYCGDKILEADIVLNALYPWAHDKNASPDPIRVIVANIATNEFGNMLGLADLYGANDARKTMYGYHDVNAEQFILDDHAVDLEPEDVDGVQWIYGTGLDADFAADQRVGVSPLTVHFTDKTKSVYPVVEWLWNFGDGKTSNAQNPVHIYTAEGDAKFDVKLTVKSSDGKHTFTETITERDFIQLNVKVAASVDAEPTIGYGPLTVKFKVMDAKGNLDKFLWDFGDGSTSKLREPLHVYENPGIYSVTMTASGTRGSITESIAGLIEVYEDAQHVGLTKLQLVEGSSCQNNLGWDNAIDGDTYHESGTTNAGKKGQAWAIFKFDDETQKKINRIRLLTDTSLPAENSGDWVNQFSLYVSTTGVDNGNFTLVKTFDKNSGNWENYAFESVYAKYVKLVVDRPSFGWRQIGEFEVYEDIMVPEIISSSVKVTSPHIANGLDAAKVTIQLTDAEGLPIIGLPKSAFRIYALPKDNTITSDETQIYTADAFFEPVMESEKRGIYQSEIGSIIPGEKRIFVRVYGIKLDITADVLFTKPILEKAELALNYGTDSWRDEGWDNAIDGIIEGREGTVSAGPKWKDCYGIFEFADGTIKPIIKYRLMTDTGLEEKGNLCTAYELYVSTTGTGDKDFQLVTQRERDFGDWEELYFRPIYAKYIKLKLLEPISDWRQIGEFEVYTSPVIGIGQTIAGGASEGAEVAGLPTTFGLNNNYPNPFNPETSISYQLPSEAQVVLRVYNMLGQEIKTLVNEKQKQGRYTVTWNATDVAGHEVASGVYFYKIDATSSDKKFSKKIKMTLLR